MYDRLREIRARKMPTVISFAQQVNLAVNQTLSRTVLTVATIVLSAGMLCASSRPAFGLSARPR